MKKLFAMILSLCMLLALAACGGKTPAPVDPEDPGKQEEPAQPTDQELADKVAA